MERIRDDVPDEQTSSPRKITPVTRRDIFDYLRSAADPWHGRLDEFAFLNDLYDLDALPSTDDRYKTARKDIGQHRHNNDWEDDWIFEDPRFELLDGPDEFLLKFLARTVHPEAQADVDLAAQKVDALNRLLAPDGWKLRADKFLSGRPIYAPVLTGRVAGPTIPLPLRDDDASKLDLLLGQTHHLLDADGHGPARDLLRDATLTLRRDGGYYHPTPGDNWTEATYEAVLTIDAELIPEFTPALTDPIWQRLSMLLGRLERGDVQSLVIERALLPLPEVAQDWRQPASPAPTNQARRERGVDQGYPTQDGLVFASQPELIVYQVLTELQRERPSQDTFAILPLPSAKLRDTAIRIPDFTVLGNGRAVIIEVDGPHHYGRTRKADDEDRDRHWLRCGIPSVRIAHEHTFAPATLKDRLREDLVRHLFPRR